MTQDPPLLAFLLGALVLGGCGRCHAPLGSEEVGRRAAGRAPSVALPREEIQEVRGVWVWKTSSITSEDPDATALLSFTARHDISEVYLSIARDSLTRADLPPFVARLRSSGLTVEALFGEATWYRPEHRHRVLDRIEEVALYNEAHPEARFSGIHLDIEPHQLPENKGVENRGYLPGLIATFAAARDAAAARGLSLSADVARKVLRASEEEGEALMTACPRLVLMLYGLDPDEIVKEAHIALGWAAPPGSGQVIVGIRARDYEQGAEDVLQKVDAALADDPAYGGWAMHDYATFRSLGAGSH